MPSNITNGQGTPEKEAIYAKKLPNLATLRKHSRNRKFLVSSAALTKASTHHLVLLSTTEPKLEKCSRFRGDTDFILKLEAQLAPKPFQSPTEFTQCSSHKYIQRNNAF